MTSEEPTFRLQPVSIVLRRVLLEHASLESHALQPTAEVDADSPLNIHYEASLATNAANGLLVRTRFRLRERPRLPYRFDVTWTAEFQAPEDVDREQLVAFGLSSGVQVLWPYARAFLADMTQKMGFQPMLLDLVLVPQPGTVEVVRRNDAAAAGSGSDEPI